ncbi:hypothetical protein [Bacillus massilinigeriensis]|uniref:hypothetical protein n=1 Tax=Bacillus massilionigeriensis TaxID=1805475 RepID=UPI00114D4684|nr:hypothetical protein [Bacillus massilionigeriensis]
MSGMQQKMSFQPIKQAGKNKKMPVNPPKKAEGNKNGVPPKTSGEKQKNACYPAINKRESQKMHDNPPDNRGK